MNEPELQLIEEHPDNKEQLERERQAIIASILEKMKKIPDRLRKD